MDKNTQQQASWEYFDGTWHVGVDGERENYEMFGYPTRDLFTAPPVPRDVLMAFGIDVADKAYDAGVIGNLFTDEDISAIADRYASQVQPERNTVTLEEIVEQLKSGENGDAISEAMTQATADMALGRAIREGRATQPEPVNQQLLVALKMVLDDPDALDGRPRTYKCVMEAIAAAEAAQAQQPPTVGRKFFIYGDDTGFDLFDSAEDAKKAAQDSIDEYRHEAGDGWPEEVERVCWGVVLGTTQQVALQDEYDGRDGLADSMQPVDYVLTEAQQPSDGLVLDAWRDGWPTDDMVIRGAEQLHDSLRQFGCYHNFDADLNGTFVQQQVAESVFRAMLYAAQKPEGGE